MHSSSSMEMTVSFRDVKMAQMKSLHTLIALPAVQTWRVMCQLDLMIDSSESNDLDGLPQPNKKPWQKNRPIQGKKNHFHGERNLLKCLIAHSKDKGSHLQTVLHTLLHTPLEYFRKFIAPETVQLRTDLFDARVARRGDPAQLRPGTLGMMEIPSCFSDKLLMRQAWRADYRGPVKSRESQREVCRRSRPSVQSYTSPAQPTPTLELSSQSQSCTCSLSSQPRA
ncbi:hypothetical protein AOLI_G00314310 [Acnodon oligacanthus]